jgi:hypothetical protein
LQQYRHFAEVFTGARRSSYRRDSRHISDETDSAEGDPKPTSAEFGGN